MPDAVLFHVNPLNWSSHPSDETPTVIIIPILQIRKLKPRKFHQPRVTQLVSSEDTNRVCVTPESLDLSTEPSCLPDTTF